MCIRDSPRAFGYVVRAKRSLIYSIVSRPGRSIKKMANCSSIMMGAALAELNFAFEEVNPRKRIFNGQCGIDAFFPTGSYGRFQETEPSWKLPSRYARELPR